MKIQDQVCSLVQSKKLKGLGVIQKGYFQWQETTNADPYINHTVFGESTNENEYAAFTVAELGVMLPQTIELNKTQKASIKIVRFNAWTISYSRHSSGIDVCSKESHSEAEARAAMLIYLLENNHITADEVNARLQS